MIKWGSYFSLAPKADQTINRITLQQLSVAYGIKLEQIESWIKLWPPGNWQDLLLEMKSIPSSQALSDVKVGTFTAPSSNQELDDWQKARQIT